MESFCPADPIYGNPLPNVSFFVQEFGYKLQHEGRYTVETKTTTSFLFTPGGRVQFPNSFTESYISRAAEVRYPCKNSDKKNVLLNSRRQYADFLCLYKILLYKIFQHQFCCFCYTIQIPSLDTSFRKFAQN